MRQESEKLAETIGCSDRIHWLGAVEHERVALLMAAAEMLLLPSRNEGLPCVLLEAGRVALPVVASREGGIPEVIEDGRNGRLVPAEDPDALAGVVLELSRDELQRNKMGKALQKTVHDHFSSERMARDYMRVYDEVW